MSEEADFGDLPPVLATIATIVGLKLALEIARQHGGTRVLVPTQPGRNWLTAIVVDETKTAALIEALGAARPLDMPLGPDGGYMQSRRWTNRRFAQMQAEGKSCTKMARELGVTDRTIRNRRRRARDRASHPDLFDL